MNLFNSLYKNRKVLITGHTGFKGSWLTMWALQLGAKVVGYSAYLPSDPCNFAACNLRDRVEDITGDVRDIDHLETVFSTYEPEIVFHLAAQPIVRRSYSDPKTTFDTNLGGTVNILECLRNSKSVEAAVIITSDKCYENLEWVWGYRENDRLGGDDPYSASKACAELACHSYIRSFFSSEDSVKLATTRAGNVIGGGDWADDRIVPDSVRAFSKGDRLEVRSPKATRPWQHVLEPLSGYLWLGANLLQKNELIAGQPFNFAPLSDVNRSVEELIKEFVKVWPNGSWYISESAYDSEKKESTLLRLNCDKALSYIGWHAVLSFEESCRLTADWYKAYYSGNTDMYSFSQDQLRSYAARAEGQGLCWAKKES